MSATYLLHTFTAAFITKEPIDRSKKEQELVTVSKRKQMSERD